MASSASWWASKVRQFGAHLRARVGSEERAGLVDWVTPPQLELFDRMHVADQRHGLDVVASLRSDGAEDPELLLAGLLHDAGKGRTGLLPRVVYSLGRRYGRWVWSVPRLVPPFGRAIDRLRDHAELSALLAARTGASERTVELIRHQDAPIDPDAGRLLLRADEAN